MNADECAQRIRAAMTGVVDARAAADGELVIQVTTRDAQGRVEDIKEQQLTGLRAAAAAAGPARFDAYLAAVATWLRAQGDVSALVPHQLFLRSLLADAKLATTADFASVLMDASRREIYAARDELHEFFGRHGLTPENDDVVRALYVLTPEGRGEKAVADVARAVRWLSSFESGRAALMAMMREWADEEYDPYDQAWERGPTWSTLLLSGTWRVLDPLIADPALRTRVLSESVDRLARPVDAATLARVGF